MSYSRDRAVPRRKTRLLLGTLLAGIAFLVATAQSPAAVAPAPDEFAGMPVTEPFDGSATSLTNFSANWSTLGWASGGTPKGSDTTAGWRPVNAYPTVNGTFYMQTVTDAGGGVAAVVTMAANPGIEERHFSLWLDMGNPSLSRAGYELRFSYVSTNSYNVTLSRWQAGAQSVLASRSNYTFADGHSLAVVDKGSTVSAWTNTGLGFAKLLSANDAALSGGNAGVEGAGNIVRLTNFKAGSLDSLADELTAMAVTEPFDGTATSRSSFTTHWSALGWASGWAPKGSETTAGWHPVLPYPIVNGTFYEPTVTAGGHAVAAVVTMAASPAGEQRHLSLWLDMSSPLGTRDGYELRFTYASTNSYNVTLSRWQAGAQFVLASRSNYTFADGHSLAVVDGGNTVSAWIDTGAGFTQLLSAGDASFSGGSAGVESAGHNTRLTNFSVGTLDSQSDGAEAPDTIIQTGPTGNVPPEGVSFAFSSTELGSTFECSFDAAAYGACSSPKAYPPLALGSHTFRVRAVDALGSQDETPAERTFQVVQAPIAITAPADPVAANAATLHATINPNGADTAYYFEYGTTTSYGSTIPATPKPVGSDPSAVLVAETLTDLAEGATYHYRAVAENEVGRTYGADEAIGTPILPAATTESASSVDANEAIVSGTIDPNGLETTYEFEYGTTTSYGSIASGATEEPRSGTDVTEATEALAHLEPETTYHYRVVASSAAGRVTGGDRTLTTAASAVTPQREQEERQEEKAFTGKFTGPLPDDFVNLMWTGNNPLTAEASQMEVIRRSGAKMLRLGVGSGDWGVYDAIFERAANRGITILAGLGGGPLPPRSEWGSWNHSVEEVVHRYGPGGDLWSRLPPDKRRPVEYWEFWNEPNIARNARNGQVNPVEFGELLEDTAGVIRAATPGSGNSHVILGGLLSVSTDPGIEDHRTPAEFLHQMGNHGRDDYMALSLHPYAFKADDNQAPQTAAEVEQVTDKVRRNIKLARDALDEVGGAGKQLWITELGWPVENPEGGVSTHPKVSLDVQRDLIESSFEMIKATSQTFGIRNVFYYNIQDWDHSDPIHMTWDYRSGLRGPFDESRPGNGNFRPGWYGFLQETGAANWPLKAKADTQAPDAQPRRAMLMGTVNPKGLPTAYRFQWGPTVLYKHSTSWQGAGFEEGDTSQHSDIGGLQPEKTYHYRIVAVNENEETTLGGDRQFTTPPSTETSAAVTQTLNGEPGWASVAGWVHEGGGLGLSNVYVNVNFQKEVGPDVWETIQGNTRHETVTNGYYHADNVALGKGSWRTKTVFPPQGEYDESQSEYHKFTLKNGYQLVAKHSGRCLDVKDGSTANTATLQQWDCLSPQTNQNQVFSLVPQGNAYYQIVARHSNRCVDVTNGSQSQGTVLQQYDCIGAGQTNQIWQGVPVEQSGANAYVHFVAKHSGQCMDVQGQQTGNGAPVTQWGCLGNQANQLWTFRSVESNQVPVRAYITVDETLNGQPGYITFHGNVDAGGYSLAGKYVNVNFQREVSPGNYQTVDGETLHLNVDGSGHYVYYYWGIGTGQWRTRVVFPGAGPLAQAESDYHYFQIKSGYRFKFRHSGRCLSTSGGGTSNGTPLIQWDCSPSPNPGDGQVFSVVPVNPVGGGYFQIRPDSAHNKCVDVAGVSQSDGAPLQLWDCLGEGQTNQIWHIVPIAGQPPWFASIAKHSNRCMDVAGVSTANGARVQQWGCYWGGNQQWEWQAIN